MTSAGHAQQLVQLLVADPSDHDFIDKIRPYRGDLEQLFKKTIIGLSEGVLLLSGFYPGPWLNQIPWNANLTAILMEQWKIFEMAKDAIRCGILSAHSEIDGLSNSTIYYVKPPDLCHWMLRENAYWIAPECADHVITLLGGLPKKRGRPQDCPEIVQKIIVFFAKTGTKSITIASLKTAEDETIRQMIEDYCRAGSGDPTRRLKTLRKLVNDGLKNTLCN